MKKSLALFAPVLAAVLNAATPSTSLVYKNTTTNALTGNIVVGNNTTLSATGNGTITATALTGNITGNPTISGNLTVNGSTISLPSTSGNVDLFGRLFALNVSNETRLYAGSSGISLYDHVGSGRLAQFTQSLLTLDKDTTVGGKLTVSGTGNSTIAGPLGLGVTPQGSNKLVIPNNKYIAWQDSVAFESIGLAASTDNALTFFNISERARITNTGNLRVGQSTDANNARIYSYYPYSASGGNAAIGTEVDDTVALRAIQFANPNGIVGTIATSGSATSFNTSSDRRLKTNIAPAGSASALIDSIQIVEHDWKAGGHVRFGVIAQDVQTVAPEVVFVGDDGEEVKSPWGVDYSKLVPALIKEVQTLRARVAALEAARN